MRRRHSNRVLYTLALQHCLFLCHIHKRQIRYKTMKVADASHTSMGESGAIWLAWNKLQLLILLWAAWACTFGLATFCFNLPEYQLAPLSPIIISYYSRLRSRYIGRLIHFETFLLLHDQILSNLTSLFSFITKIGLFYILPIVLLNSVFGTTSPYLILRH